nr:immunoglobulin heavy chain junction region [Macaca mulatta]MOV40672.1 immunoglobulin heavy chain junction region [Macaca mulatta]MOV41106.1 immunoglobulin heavy chain junction region [Macaca mulatta]
CAGQYYSGSLDYW